MRKYRAATLILFVAFPLVMLAISTLLSLAGASDSAVLYFAIPYAMFFLYVGTRWSYARCPACARPMLRKGIMFCGLFNCVHCGYNLKDENASNRNCE